MHPHRMAASPARRKLCAVLCADVAGYSRLMAQDELGTIASLNEARALFRARVQAHQGRVVDTTGDSVLADFESPVEAVACAAEIQDELRRRNEGVTAQRSMQFRIGVNLGDVVDDGTALYGDGVNIAARLQELAQPGSLCISGTVFDQIEGKLPLSFRYLGEQSVKNIPRPVRTYALATGEEAVAKTLAMPTGPSIAVLPFLDMSSGSENDYFCDGLTEDIIIELARVRELHVLARNTTFQYKGRAVDVPALGRQLGVHYILEGSVRRAANRLRINVQLIEVATGVHRWADRFDREMQDILAVQDAITGRIVGALAGGFGAAMLVDWRRLSGLKRPTDLTAYELVLKANAAFVFTEDTYAQAKRYLEEAIAIDPRYARARHDLAWLMLRGWIFRLEKTPQVPAEIRRNAVESVRLDPSDALAHRTAAYGYFFDRQLDLFEREARIALELAPFNAEIFVHLGMAISFTGQWERGVALVNKGFALNEMSAGGWCHTAWHYDHYNKGDYARALEACRQHPYQGLTETKFKYIPCYGQLGDVDKAREYFELCRQAEPEFSADWVGNILRTWNFQDAFIAHYLEGFAKAGYPPTGRA
jgi:TolB-like protein/tetratricopeptide (TPR) repeat protein